jgi:hypothetical protein
VATDEEDHLRAGATRLGRIVFIHCIDHVAGLAGAFGDNLLLQVPGVHLLLKLRFADPCAEL